MVFVPVLYARRFFNVFNDVAIAVFSCTSCFGVQDGRNGHHFTSSYVFVNVSVTAPPPLVRLLLVSR